MQVDYSMMGPELCLMCISILAAKALFLEGVVSRLTFLIAQDGKAITP